MAINWTMAAALDAVKENKKEAIVDLGKRFPLTLKALIETGENSGAATIIGALPDHITVRKIESVLKDGVDEAVEDDEQETEKPAKKEKPTKAEKKPAKKQVEDDEDDEEQDYSDMSARELFDLCKKRGIAAKPKQTEDAYIKLLKKADAAAEEEEDDWDEEEEEKPAKKPAKKEVAKKEEKKPAKKAAKKEEDEDEDDEDWDI